MKAKVTKINKRKTFYTARIGKRRALISWALTILHTVCHNGDD